LGLECPRCFWKSRERFKAVEPRHDHHPGATFRSIETGLVQAADLAQVGDALKLSRYEVVNTAGLRA